MKTENTRRLLIQSVQVVSVKYHPDEYWDDQEANTDAIKFCGFGKCPNRYAYITRPEIIKAVYSTNKTVFLTRNDEGQTIVKVIVE